MKGIGKWRNDNIESALCPQTNISVNKFHHSFLIISVNSLNLIRTAFFSQWTLQTSLHLLLLSNPLNCLQTQSNCLTLIWLYRPPQSITIYRNYLAFFQFLEDFQTLISSGSTCFRDFLITGDNHVDDLTVFNAIKFLSLLNNANLTQHVSCLTHRHSYALDLGVMPANSTSSHTVIPSPDSHSNHFPNIYSLKITNYSIAFTTE